LSLFLKVVGAFKDFDKFFFQFGLLAIVTPIPFEYLVIVPAINSYVASGALNKFYCNHLAPSQHYYCPCSPPHPLLMRLGYLEVLAIFEAFLLHSLDDVGNVAMFDDYILPHFLVVSTIYVVLYPLGSFRG